MAANFKAVYQLALVQKAGWTAAAVYKRICYWEKRSHFEHEGHPSRGDTNQHSRQTFGEFCWSI
ncbi:MAG: hypothetical protein AAF704_03965 [Cyanobacteria bacterium P01_D01_bin.123]